MPILRAFRASAPLAAALIPAALAAQSIRGVVIDAGAVPVAGVVVQLLDSTQTVASRALTNERGEFLVATTRPGTYTVRTLRIGFRPVTSAPITLASGEERSQRFELAGIPIALASVHIDGGDAVCGRATRDSSAAAFTIWEQVRTALAATQITAGARAMTVTAITYTRALDPLGRTVLSEKADISTSAVSQPWLERTPDQLHTQGYVIDEGALGFTYHLPGLEMLGSATFLEDHCLRVDRASGNQLVGIAFEPTDARKATAEVRGTAWLDRTTSELRSVDFRYANISDERAQLAGGTMEFARMKSGAWAIVRWNLRMPVLEQVTREARLGGVMVKLAELHVTGAELTVARRGADTLWARAPATLTGVVLDSASNVPVDGAVATIAGTGKTGTTNAQGRFTIDDVMPGEYKVDVRTPSLDSVKAVHQSTVTFIDTAATNIFRVPNASFIRRVLEMRNSSVFAGVVLTDSTEKPIAGVTVEIPALKRSATTDAAGNFRMVDVPAGLHRVVVRRVGYRAYDSPVPFAAGHVVQRRILLPQLTELDSVRVVAEGTSLLPLSYVENKAVGLGRFIGREQIEVLGARRLGGALEMTGGAGVLGAGRWVISKRVPPRLQSKGSTAIYYPSPSEKARGLVPGCYPKVYIGTMLMNPETPTEPFDLATIPTENVEAMEWYAGAASTPVMYTKLNSNCGVLVIHLRR